MKITVETDTAATVVIIVTTGTGVEPETQLEADIPQATAPAQPRILGQLSDNELSEDVLLARRRVITDRMEEISEDTADT